MLKGAPKHHIIQPWWVTTDFQKNGSTLRALARYELHYNTYSAEQHLSNSRLCWYTKGAFHISFSSIKHTIQNTFILAQKLDPLLRAIDIHYNTAKLEALPRLETGTAFCFAFVLSFSSFFYATIVKITSCSLSFFIGNWTDINYVTARESSGIKIRPKSLRGILSSDNG